MLLYRHNQMTLDRLMSEVDALFDSFRVQAAGRSETGFTLTYTGADGQEMTATVTGTGFAFAGNRLTGGEIEVLNFLAAGTWVGSIEGLGLDTAEIATLTGTRRGMETWLLEQDWNTHWSHAFQEVSNVTSGTRIGDGVVMNMRGDDYISLSFQADRFFTGDGNDILYGRNGNDRLEGGKGNDTIKGNQDNDKLQGGAGDDDLYGGSGRDRLTGGAGADDFRWEVDYGDTGLSLDGPRDTITDFNPDEDRIILELSDVGVTGRESVRFLDHEDGTLVRIRYSTAGESLRQDILILGTEPGEVGSAEIVFT